MADYAESSYAESSPSKRVLVRGVNGPLGATIAQRLKQDPALEVTFDEDLLACDVIVDATVADYDLVARRAESLTKSGLRLLQLASRTAAQHLIVITSALVYGAVANNPVPLTEDAVLRPDPTFVYARQLAAVEEMIDAWRLAQPGRTVTTLRPVILVAEVGTSTLARSLTYGLGRRWGKADPGGQFIHHRDVATAVDKALQQTLDGVFNLAPDGHIPGERLQALAGRSPQVPLPDRGREVVDALRWRFRTGPIPPGLSPYTQNSWIVANDKMRATGWTPTVTNEQAFVAETATRWWMTITPKRRQEITFALFGGTLIAAVVAAGLATVSLARGGLRGQVRR